MGLGFELLAFLKSIDFMVILHPNFYVKKWGRATATTYFMEGMYFISTPCLSINTFRPVLVIFTCDLVILG
jgi:hypothetical protein